MQLSSAELIVTIVFAIVGLLMGFVSGAMPLQPQRMTPAQATAQKVLGFAIVAVVVVLALASMNVAMWTTLIAVALGILRGFIDNRCIRTRYSDLTAV